MIKLSRECQGVIRQVSAIEKALFGDPVEHGTL